MIIGYKEIWDHRFLLVSWDFLEGKKRTIIQSEVIGSQFNGIHIRIICRHWEIRDATGQTFRHQKKIFPNTIDDFTVPSIGNSSIIECIE